MSIPTKPCPNFAHQLQQFLAGELSPKKTHAWRDHCHSCTECSQRFARALEHTALLARPMRLDDERFERKQRRALHRRLAMAGAVLLSGGGRKRGSWQRAKTMVLPALLVLLFTRVSINQGPKAQVWASQGSMWLNGRPLDPALPPRTVDRGSWCATGVASRANLVWPTGRAELGASTLAAVEDGRASRVRLEHGVLRFQGTGQVTTQSGVVEIQAGGCLVRHDAAGLCVEEVSGKVRRMDASGEIWLCDSPGPVSVR